MNLMQMPTTFKHDSASDTIQRGHCKFGAPQADQMLITPGLEYSLALIISRRPFQRPLLCLRASHARRQVLLLQSLVCGKDRRIPRMAESFSAPWRNCSISRRSLTKPVVLLWSRHLSPRMCSYVLVAHIGHRGWHGLAAQCHRELHARY